MKIFITIVFLTFIITNGQASEIDSCISQIDSISKREVYKSVDKMPTVDGGMQTLFTVVSNRIKYPNYKQPPVESKVLVAFVVTEHGAITGQRIIKNISGTDFAEQLLNVVNELKWQPGLCHGEPVPTIFILPMNVDFK